MTSATIIEALAGRFCAPEYAFLTEVRNTTGAARVVRSADALAMSLWPSRGLYLTGFEVKVSRGDWLKELADPSKTEEMARYCRHWFVATPKGLIKTTEMPPNWGLIEITDKENVRFTKPAAEMPAEEPNWKFFASLLRNVTATWTPTSLVNKRIREREQEIEKASEACKGFREKNAEDRANKAHEQIAAFEKASGIQLDRYSEYFNAEIGQAVKLLREVGSHGSPIDKLVSARTQLEQLAEAAKTLEEFCKETKSPNQSKTQQ